MDTIDRESPDISEFERLIDENWNERMRLIDRESELRTELQSIIRPGISPAKFEEARGRELESRASLKRNVDQYDTLVSDWAAATMNAEYSIQAGSPV